MTTQLSRPAGVRGWRALPARMRRRPISLLLGLAFALLSLGVFLGAEYPEAWYTRAIVAIASLWR